MQYPNGHRDINISTYRDREKERGRGRDTLVTYPLYSSSRDQGSLNRWQSSEQCTQWPWESQATLTETKITLPGDWREVQRDPKTSKQPTQEPSWAKPCSSLSLPLSLTLWSCFSQNQSSQFQRSPPAPLFLSYICSKRKQRERERERERERKRVRERDLEQCHQLTLALTGQEVHSWPSVAQSCVYLSLSPSFLLSPCHSYIHLVIGHRPVTHSFIHSSRSFACILWWNRCKRFCPAFPAPKGREWTSFFSEAQDTEREGSELRERERERERENWTQHTQAREFGPLFVCRPAPGLDRGETAGREGLANCKLFLSLPRKSRKHGEKEEEAERRRKERILGDQEWSTLPILGLRDVFRLDERATKSGHPRVA